GIDVDAAGMFVDREYAVDVPVACADRVLQLAVQSRQIQMMPTAALAAPDERVLLFEEMQVVVEIDPGLAGLAEERALLQCGGVDEVQIQVLLVALHELIAQAPAVRQPVDAGEIDVVI